MRRGLAGACAVARGETTLAPDRPNPSAAVLVARNLRRSTAGPAAVEIGSQQPHRVKNLPVPSIAFLRKIVDIGPQQWRGFARWVKHRRAGIVSPFVAIR